MDTNKQSFTGDRTKAVHAGEFPDPLTKASLPNLVMSTAFVTDADTAFSCRRTGR
ncbi:MAG: hypothetical protein LBH90_01685 [Tannerella sp.]|jgi:methionine-gamma-lyase|nr:hypothetical protein [Tannerella sp.]